MLQEETGLRAPPPNKTAAYLFFSSSHIAPPDTLRTHRLAALPPARRLAVLSSPPTACAGYGGAEWDKRVKRVVSIDAVDLDALQAALMKREEAELDEQLQVLCEAAQRDDSMVLGGENQLMARLMAYDAARARNKILPLMLSHLSSASPARLSSTPHSSPSSASSSPQSTDPSAAHTALHLAYLFSYLTTGSALQCQHLISLGIVPRLTFLLASSTKHNVRTTECALTSLGNLSADSTCRSLVVLSGATDILMRLLLTTRRREHELRPNCDCIDCHCLPSRRLCMWILSLLARSMCSSSSPHFYSALAPLVQPLCALSEVETDADLSVHLLFFLYSVTTSSPDTYRFPLSPWQQSHHTQLCALLPQSILPALVATLTHDNASLAYAALSILSNLAFASLTQLTHLVESTHLLPQLTVVWTQLASQSLTDISLLQSTQLNFIVSCLAASPSQSHLVQLLSETRLVDAMVLDLSSSLLPVSRNAAWAVANLTRGWWSVSRKDQSGHYKLYEDGGRAMVETRERRRLLAEKPELMRGLCALLSVEYEEDADHAELLQVALVAVSNLLSDEWWVHDILRTEGQAGVEKADVIRRNYSLALELALGYCSSRSLHSHPSHPLPPDTISPHAALPVAAQQLPPYSCFQSACQASYVSTVASFPTASPHHPPSSHPLTAAFLSHYGLALLSRLESSRVWYVRRFAAWMVCLFFTEYCNRHELHLQADYEAVNELDLIKAKEVAGVEAEGKESGAARLDARAVVVDGRPVAEGISSGKSNTHAHEHQEAGNTGCNSCSSSSSIS